MTYVHFFPWWWWWGDQAAPDSNALKQESDWLSTQAWRCGRGRSLAPLGRGREGGRVCAREMGGAPMGVCVRLGPRLLSAWATELAAWLPSRKKQCVRASPVGQGESCRGSARRGETARGDPVLVLFWGGPWCGGGAGGGAGGGGIAPPSALSLSLVRLLTRPRASASLSGGNGPSPHPPPWWHAHRAARVRASCPDRRAGRVTATWHENLRLSSSSSRSAHTASPSCSPWAPPCPSSRTRCCR